MRLLFAAIDGTGSSAWRRGDGANSHVARLHRDVRAERKHYLDGPDTFGFKLNSLVGAMTDWVVRALEEMVRDGARQDEIAVALVGHSRGAVGVMEVANRLREERPPSLHVGVKLRFPIRVRFIGLYDAVDRSPMNFDAGSLRNVDFVAHAVRGNRKWSGSRWTFGTVAVPVGERAEFDTSHGGIGGDPGFFENAASMSKDQYCNAMTLILSDQELLRRYGMVAVGDPHGFYSQYEPRFTQLAGPARAERIADLKRCWEKSWEADVWMRKQLIAACGEVLPARSAEHVPYGEADEALAVRLARELGLGSLKR